MTDRVIRSCAQFGLNTPAVLLAVILLTIILTSCGPGGEDKTPTPTVATPPLPLATLTLTSTLTPTATFIIMCTPPLCRESEIYYCPGDCPGGCGTTCATITPTPTPPSFICVDCELGSALEYFCPLARGSDDAKELLTQYGKIQSGNVSDHACLYVVVFDGYSTYVYYLDDTNGEIKFVVIDPNILTPSLTPPCTATATLANP